MFTKSKLLKDQGDCVESMNQYCTDIISKYKYDDGDTRTRTPANIRSFGYFSLAMLSLLDGMQSEDAGIRTIISKLLGMQNPSANQTNTIGRIIRNTSKMSLIVLGQFQVENCLKLISEAIGIKLSTGFYNISKTLLNELGLNKDMVDVLNTGALIRNSLHSNGIHHGFNDGDFSSNIDGIKYEFKHGKKVSCATFPHIAHALEGSLIVLDEIFNTAKVIAIVTLKDQHIPQQTIK